MRIVVRCQSSLQTLTWLRPVRVSEPGKAAGLLSTGANLPSYRK
jgi:hypothetical protein